MQQRPTSRPSARSLIVQTLALVGLLLAAGLGLVSSSAAQGQGGEEDAGLIEEGLAAPAPAPEGAAAPIVGVPQPAAEGDLRTPRQGVRVFLPALRGAPGYTAQFAAELDADLNPINPSSSFKYGVRRLYAVLGVRGAAGKAWTIEWRRNGLIIPGLTRRGTIPAGEQSARLVRQLSYANGGALPTGSYQVVLYIDGARVLAASASVVR